MRGVAAALRPMSMAAVRRCGAAVGRVAHAVDAFHRDIARDNLAHAFPTRTDAERRAIARDMFAHFGSV